MDALVSLTELTADSFAESLGAAAPELGDHPQRDVRGLPAAIRPAEQGRHGGRAMIHEKQLDLAIRPSAGSRRVPRLGSADLRRRPAAISLRRLVGASACTMRIESVGRSPADVRGVGQGGPVPDASRGEAFALVMLETLAAGVPVVAYDNVTGPPRSSGARSTG